MPPESAGTLQIDLLAIEHNVAVLRRVLSVAGPPVAGLCAVLKADGYGLGARRVAHRLEAAAVEMIAVFSPGQARELVEAAVATPLLILMPVREIRRTDPLYRALVKGQLHLVLHDLDQLDALARQANQFGTRIPLHLELDTGMRRGGMREPEAREAIRLVAGHPRLVLAGLFSHFAQAGASAAATEDQHRRFSTFVESVRDQLPPECAVHLAATYGCFRSTAYHFDMVRIGLGLFGFATEDMSDTDGCALIDHAADLRPAARLTSHVAHLSSAREGEDVGYKATWRAPRDTRLALAPLGYADGYPMSLSNRGVARVHLKNGAWLDAPVVGRISMDQLMLDVTDAPESQIGVGAEIELIGRDKDAATHLPHVAKLAGTTTHELLGRLSPRLKRVYTSHDESTPTATLVKARGAFGA